MCNFISLQRNITNLMVSSNPVLLSIIEFGGYPDFSGLYRETGYEVIATDSVRKAVKLIRKHKPTVIVAEFNFQSDFRDRTSSLETVFSSLQGVVEANVIVFYEKEYSQQYQKLLSQFKVFESLEFPIDAERLNKALQAAKLENPG